MVLFLFLLDLPLLMASYGRRFGFPLPAAAAAFLVFASPAFGWDGTSAYVDVAASTILFALFYLLEIWQAGRRTCLLAPIGILAGFSFSAKYSAAIGIPYALGLVAGAIFSLPWLLNAQGPFWQTPWRCTSWSCRPCRRGAPHRGRILALCRREKDPIMYLTAPANVLPFGTPKSGISPEVLPATSGHSTRSMRFKAVLIDTRNARGGLPL